MRIARVVFALVLIAALAVESRGAAPRPLIATINTVTITPTPAVVGSTTQFTVTATSPGMEALAYRWIFGDGGQSSMDTANSTVSYTYGAPGHYTVLVEVQELTSGTIAQTTRPLTVHNPLTSPKPTNSSTIILDSTRGRIWVVNPDQDTVSTINTTTNAVTEIAVGKNPRTLAQAADGTIWVVSQTHPSVSILSPTAPFTLQHVVPLPHGSAPYGICMSPDGSSAYVSFQGTGGVWKIDTAGRGVQATTTTPPSARGIAVTGDGRVLVTRFISPVADPLLDHNDAAFKTGNRGEVVELSPSLGTVRTFNLAIDPGVGGADPDFGLSIVPTANGSRGQPNYISSLIITPDGLRAWVPSKKDNIQRGIGPQRDGRTPGPEVAYRSIVSALDLSTNTAPIVDRRDLNDSEMPQAACTSPNGDYLFISLQGTNRIQVWDLFNMTAPLNNIGNVSGTTPTNGLAPQGVVIDPATKILWVQNYMGRTVSKIDATAILNSNGVPTNLPAPSLVIATVTTADQLTASVLLGKQVFYNAGDARMSLNGYISCAGCHLDGGSDMRVFDFTNRGEGFRNTVMLQGRGGTGHGNVHWTANFNEIQDFDNDVYFQFHFGNPSPGPGPANSSFTLNPNAPLGTANATRDASLDAMAAYVASLDKVARSPFRNEDGTLTANGAAGEVVFKTLNCQRCHSGRNFTDSTVGTLAAAVDPAGPVAPNTPILHNVGTLRATSGQRLGGALQGIDTPTLKGVWQTAPYLHDGSAATLRAVIDMVPLVPALPNVHGSMHTLSDTDKANLERYMLEIDEIDAPPVPPTQVNTLFLGSINSGRPYSLATAAATRLPYVDRSYTITSLSGTVNGGILLRTAENDKTSTSSSQMTFTVPASTDVYVYYDSRKTSLPTWLQSGWTALGAPENIILSPGLTMNAFRMNPQPAAGLVTLGGNQEGGPTGALRNYFVILVRPGAVFEEGPISQGEWVHPRDGDGDGLEDEFEAITIPAIPAISPWKVNSVTAGVSDEDQLDPAGGGTLFDANASFTFVPPVGGGGGGGGGCGLGGLEFLIPLLALRLLRRRLP